MNLWTGESHPDDQDVNARTVPFAGKVIKTIDPDQLGGKQRR